MTTGNNHFYETTDFNLAIYLHSSGVTFRGLRWPTPQQALFLFDEPPADLLVSWMKDDGKFIRKFTESRNFLRDVLEGKRDG